MAVENVTYIVVEIENSGNDIDFSNDITTEES